MVWQYNRRPAYVTYYVTLPDGLYGINDINAYMQSIFIQNGHYSIDTATGNYVYYITMEVNTVGFTYLVWNTHGLDFGWVGKKIILTAGLLIKRGWSSKLIRNLLNFRNFRPNLPTYNESLLFNELLSENFTNTVFLEYLLLFDRSALLELVQS